jgi:hypothetical protein
VQNASIIVDSNSSQAASTVGNAYVADPNKPIDITGTNPGYSGTFVGTVYTAQPPVPDPLAYLPAPDPASLTVLTAGGGQSVSLQPGVYKGGLHFSGQTSVTMAPGVYYMDGGTFDFSGQRSLTAKGVMIYSTGGLSITGNGSVTLSPPTSGIYQGISYFQDRGSTATAKVAGNGNYNVTGTFYVADGLTDLQGNGDASVASQVVTLLMTAGGNGVTNIVWAGPPAPGRGRSSWWSRGSRGETERGEQGSRLIKAETGETTLRPCGSEGGADGSGPANLPWPDPPASARPGDTPGTRSVRARSRRAG